jgi:hypothetical protein
MIAAALYIVMHFLGVACANLKGITCMNSDASECPGVFTQNHGTFRGRSCGSHRGFKIVKCEDLFRRSGSLFRRQVLDIKDNPDCQTATWTDCNVLAISQRINGDFESIAARTRVMVDL